MPQDEFETIISDPTCIAWLSAMGFETSMLSGQARGLEGLIGFAFFKV